MSLLKLSWKNIIARPLHSLLSILLIALSVALVAFLMLFNAQLKTGLDNNLAGIDLVIGAKGSPLQLILNSMYHIDAPTGNISLEESGPFLNPRHPLISQSIPLSLGDSYGAFRIAGAPQQIIPFYGATMIAGEVYDQDFEVVIGSDVADKMHMHIGDHFFSTHGLEENPDLLHDHSAPFVVTGILQRTSTVLDQLILTTPQTVWKVHEHDTSSASAHDESHDHAAHEEDHHHHEMPDFTAIDTSHVRMLSDSIISNLRSDPTKEITSILIRFKNRTSLPALNFLRNINQNTGLMAASPAYELNRLYAMMGDTTKALGYMAMLIALVAAISIFISLYNSLKERRYEIAIIRVHGATPLQVFLMILFEGLIISMLGLIIGMVAGHIGMELAGNMLQNDYKYSFSGWLWVHGEYWIIMAAIGVGILASLLPAIQGSGINLHKTLAEG